MATTDEESTPLLSCQQSFLVSKNKNLRLLSRNYGNLTVGTITLLAILISLYLLSENYFLTNHDPTSLVAFKVVNPGDPMLPGDELWVEGSTSSESAYKMVYDDGTIRLYSKERADAVGKTSVWGQLWTAAKYNGGWGEPYWDISTRVKDWPVANVDEAVLAYTARTNSVPPYLTLMDPDTSEPIYQYKLTFPAWGCDQIKFILTDDGNLLLQPYQSAEQIAKIGRVTCNNILQSKNYKDNTLNVPSAAPTISGNQLAPSPTQKPINNPTKRPTAIPTFEPTKKSPTSAPSPKPTSKPVTKSPTRSPTKLPTKTPTRKPTRVPTKKPTRTPTKRPTTKFPSRKPTKQN